MDQNTPKSLSDLARQASDNPGDASLFPEVLQAACREFGWSAASLGEFAQVGTATATRWLEQRSLPHPAFRQALYQRLASRLDAFKAGESTGIQGTSDAGESREN